MIPLGHSGPQYQSYNCIPQGLCRSLFEPKVPKKIFLENIAKLLVDTRISIRKLETLLSNNEITEKYSDVLKSSDLLFLPPFQMYMMYVFFGLGQPCYEVIEKVNVELEPLGITLQCP